MNWRRGFLFAGVHLLVSVSGIIVEESEIWHYLKGANELAKSRLIQPVAWQEEQTVTFSPDPCDLWREPSGQEQILAAAEFPALLLSGFGNRCQPELGLASLTARIFGKTTRPAEAFSMAVFSILVVVQWLLIGGHPLVRNKRSWLDPGLGITALAVAGVWASALIADRLPGAAAAYAILLEWLAYIIALTWVSIRSGWRFVMRDRPVGSRV